MTFNSFHDPSHLYFVTASVCGWMHLFIEPTYAHLVLNSLDWLRREKSGGIIKAKVNKGRYDEKDNSRCAGYR